MRTSLGTACPSQMLMQSKSVLKLRGAKPAFKAWGPCTAPSKPACRAEQEEAEDQQPREVPLEPAAAADPDLLHLRAAVPGGLPGGAGALHRGRRSLLPAPPCSMRLRRQACAQQPVLVLPAWAAAARLARGPRTCCQEPSLVLGVVSPVREVAVFTLHLQQEQAS